MFLIACCVNLTRLPLAEGLAFGIVMAAPSNRPVVVWDRCLVSLGRRHNVDSRSWSRLNAKKNPANRGGEASPGHHRSPATSVGRAAPARRGRALYDPLQLSKNIRCFSN